VSHLQGYRGDLSSLTTPHEISFHQPPSFPPLRQWTVFDLSDLFWVCEFLPSLPYQGSLRIRLPFPPTKKGFPTRSTFRIHSRCHTPTDHIPLVNSSSTTLPPPSPHCFMATTSDSRCWPEFLLPLAPASKIGQLAPFDLSSSIHYPILSCDSAATAPGFTPSFPLHRPAQKNRLQHFPFAAARRTFVVGVSQFFSLRFTQFLHLDEIVFSPYHLASFNSFREDRSAPLSQLTSNVRGCLHDSSTSPWFQLSPLLSGPWPGSPSNSLTHGVNMCIIKALSVSTLRTPQFFTNLTAPLFTKLPALRPFRLRFAVPGFSSVPISCSYTWRFHDKAPWASRAP